MSKNEQNELIRFLDKRFNKIDQKFEQVERKFNNVDQRFNKLDHEIKSIKEEMIGMNRRIEKRFLEVAEMIDDLASVVVTKDEMKQYIEEKDVNYSEFRAVKIKGDKCWNRLGTVEKQLGIVKFK